MYNSRTRHLTTCRPTVVSSNNNGDEWAQCLNDIGASQSNAAFERVYRHFGPRLNSYFLRLGCDARTAEEMVQEAMLLIWRRAETFDRSKAKASTWIFTLARNRFIDLKCRKAGPTELLPADDLYPVLADEADPTDEQVDLLRRGGQLRLRMQELPEAQAEAIEKSYFEDKTHQEIADELGIPVGTVKSRLRLALQRLNGIFVQG